MGKNTKKQAKKGPSGGVMMNMRSGMKKVAGTNAKASKKQWTFQQVLMIVLGVAGLLVLVYAFTRL